MNHVKTYPPAPHDRAFTLVELLTVIAIIGILAALIIPTVGKVRSSARAVQCISNLRQMGTAMALATEDRRGRLPGPFLSGQGFGHLETYTAWDPATVSESNGAYLHVRLSPYMGIPADGATRRVLSLFCCPGFRPAGGAINSPSYLLPSGVNGTKGSSFGTRNGFTKDYESPFGYPVTDPNEPPLPPMTMMQLTALPLPPSRLWAISDAFKKMPGYILGTPGWIAGVPDNPAHGKYGNALFFDWHVGKLDSNGPVR
ncbi:prepilin-type N-terminal cleavage/methylation domain-containing protein [Opitutaceae bacterium TAV1]|nr:prepilin-type N-terminal cleavage/methylation domain-containing protein [Opitutaceae bacterium TAV1]